MKRLLLWLFDIYELMILDEIKWGVKRLFTELALARPKSGTSVVCKTKQCLTI